jgi:hypothetical protein
MAGTISVDRHSLHYSDGSHTLTLPVEWSYIAKTDESPIDLEILAQDLSTWTEPAGEPIDPVRREQLLDEIAAHYAKGPAADILGPHGALLRGPSKFKFYLQIPPTPSRYYEVGRFLAIPMAPPQGKQWHEKYVLDFTGVREWTEPRLSLEASHLHLIAERIVRRERIGVKGLPAL